MNINCLFVNVSCYPCKFLIYIIKIRDRASCKFSVIVDLCTVFINDTFRSCSDCPPLVPFPPDPNKTINEDLKPHMRRGEGNTII